MKNAMQKDFWREIQHTRSRFFSIMILVALSVAFLSGLKATAPDMKRTGERTVPTTVYVSCASASERSSPGVRVMRSPIAMFISESMFSSTTHSSARSGMRPPRSSTSLMLRPVRERTLTTASSESDEANASMTYSPSASSTLSCARREVMSSSVRPSVEST